MFARWAICSLPILARWTLSLALIVSAASCAHAQETSADTSFSSASDFYRRSEWTAAADAFANFVADHPDDPQSLLAQIYRAESLAQEQRWAEVLLQLKQLKESEVSLGTHALAPENQKQIQFRRAEATFFTQQWSSAREQLALFLQTHPHDSRASIAWLYSAEAALAQSDFASAHAACKSLQSETTDKPLLLAAQLLMAKSLIGLEQSEGAIALYESAIATNQLDPTAHATSLLALAHLHRSLGHSREAMDTYQRLTSIPDSPDLDTALYELSFLQKQSQEPAKAIASLSRLLQEIPDSEIALDARYRLAQIHVEGRQLDLALVALPTTETKATAGTKAATTELATRITLLRAEILGRQAKWTEAAQILQPLQTQTLTAEEANLAEYWRGEAAYRLADYATALACFESLDERLGCSAAKISSSSTTSFMATVVLRRAQSLSQRKQFIAAEEVTADFLKHYPDSSLLPQALYLEAQLHLHAKRFEQAHTSLEQILESTTPPDPQTRAMAQWLRGETMRLQGRLEPAILAYQKVLSQNDQPLWQASALLQQGICQQQLQRLTEAKATFEDLIKRFPSSTSLPEAQTRLTSIDRLLLREARRLEQVQ